MTRIISQELYDRIRDNDPTMTELVFGSGITDFFGGEKTITYGTTKSYIISQRGGYLEGLKTGLTVGKTQPHCSLKRDGGIVHSGIVQKALSHQFYYDPHQCFEFKYIEPVHTKWHLKNAAFAKEEDIIEFYSQKQEVNKPYPFNPREKSGIEELAEALKQNKTITNIDTISDDLSTSLIDKRDILCLLSSIRLHPTLTKLSLGKIELTDQGLHMLTDMLSQNRPQLRFLNIQCKDIIFDKNKLLQIYDAVKMNNTLEHIHIGHSVGEEEAMRIEKSTVTNFFRNQSDQKQILRIGVNNSTEEIIQAIQQTIREKVITRSPVTANREITSSQSQATENSETVTLLQQIVQMQQQQMQEMQRQLDQMRNQSSFSPKPS